MFLYKTFLGVSIMDNLKLYESVEETVEEVIYRVAKNLIFEYGDKVMLSEEDIKQVARQRIFENIGQYNPKKGDLEAFLATVARNAIINEYNRVSARSDKQDVYVSDEEDERKNKVSEVLNTDIHDFDQSELFTILEGLLNKEEYRITQLKFEGNTVDDIADMMEMHPSSIKRRLGNIKRKIEHIR